MTPAHFLFVSALTLTPNGKLDRKALPAPETTRAESTKPFSAPRNATEQAIADVWKAVLRVDRVGIDDHFFELGGDSILSIQVIARCRQHGLRLTPKDLFKSPTIAQLAQVVTAAPSSQTSSAVQVSGAVPLTPIQQWFFEQNFAEAHHWNQAFMFTVAADFDASVFERALAHVSRHHDALRLRYQHTDAWTQRYADEDPNIGVQRIDLSKLAQDQQQAAITKHASNAQTQLNLATGPLVSAVYFALGPAQPGRLMLAIHHLIVDGVSWRVLREDLESAYLAIRSGTAPRLTEKTSSMQTWAKRVVEYAQSSEIRGSLEYWLAASQIRAVALPADRSSATATAGNGQAHAEQVTKRLSDAETRALLQQLPSVFRTQINDVLLSALARALQRSIGGNAFRIDLEGHGRELLTEDLDVSRTVGWFTTLFPVALEFAPGSDTLGTLLAVRDQLRKLPHRGMSYGLLRYGSHDDTTRAALAATQSSSILFNYLGQFDAVVADSDLFAFASESTGPWRSPAARRTHALEIIAIVREGHLEIEWHYDANVHNVASIERVANDMLAELRNLLAIANSNPTVPFTPADFPLARLDQAALTRLLSRYPHALDIYPLTPMQRLFFAMEASQSNLGFEQWHFRIEGAIDSRLLWRAIEYVIARHSILRTAFISEGGAEPVQIVSRAASLPWSEEDWRGDTAAGQATRVAALLQADAKTGFELAQAPAMRVTLRHVSDTSCHFIWSTHHLCIDGWSWPLVFRDVSRAYAALESGEEPALEPVIPFRDYVEWLTESAPRSEEFWRDQLKGFSTPTPLRLGLAAAAEDSRPQGSSSHFAELSITVPADITAQLQALARREQLTLSVVLNAAWSLLLAHYNSTTDVVFGAAFSGRPSEVRGIESMVGPCVNNLPVRVAVALHESLGSWLAGLQQRQFEIAQHQYAPLEQIQQWANIPWRHRLFDSLIVFQNYQVDDEARRIGATAKSILIAAPEATNYPLTLTVTVTDQIRVRFIYQPAAVATEDVQQFAADLTLILPAMAQSSATTPADMLARLPQGLRGKASELAAARQPARSGPYSAPTNEAERVIAAVWQELFGVERVSLDDNFFELGGHSLLLVRAHAQLRERLRADLPIVALLQYPTIRALARHLTDGPSGGPAPQAAIDRAQKQREAQQRQRSLAGRR
jgi:non-ribosomal peptide synthase protein (TIGR01720 family)